MLQSRFPTERFELEGMIDSLMLLRQKYVPLYPRREDLLGCLHEMDHAHLLFHYATLACLMGDSLQGNWSFDDTDAAYFSLRSWDRPEEARAHARFFLADLAQYICERSDSHTRVLLLLKHPEYLLDPEEIVPLFARMDQARGSVFVAARSTADFGKAAPRLLKNASMLLVHRSLTTLPFEHSLSLLWEKHHPFFDGTLQRLPPSHCFAIADGSIIPVTVSAAPLDYRRLIRTRDARSTLPEKRTTGGDDLLKRQQVAQAEREEMETSMGCSWTAQDPLFPLPDDLDDAPLKPDHSVVSPSGEQECFPRGDHQEGAWEPRKEQPPTVCMLPAPIRASCLYGSLLRAITSIRGQLSMSTTANPWGIQITPASPEQIRSWSYAAPDHRTYQRGPEPDLFAVIRAA